MRAVAFATENRKQRTGNWERGTVPGGIIPPPVASIATENRKQRTENREPGTVPWRIIPHSPFPVSCFLFSVAIREKRHRHAGYTLVELLAVIAILALLMGLSVAAFTVLPARAEHEQAAGTLRTLLRRARAAAVESRAGATLEVAPHHVAVRSWRRIALWRFEDLGPDPAGGKALRSIGARGMVASVTGAQSCAGRIGQGLQFDGPGEWADCGDAPMLSPPDGVRLEAWVFPADFAAMRLDPKARARPSPPDASRPAPRGGHAPWEFQIAAKGEEYALRAREDYAVIARVKGERGLEGFVETRPGALAPDRWTHVALIFDASDPERDRLRIEIDGVRADRPTRTDDPCPARITPTPDPLMLSSKDMALAFVGDIDEVAVSGLALEEEASLGEGVRLSGAKRVRFDAEGALDPLEHDAPASITVSAAGVKAADGTPLAPATVVVDRSGAIR
jgi:prepilin-type N-terminal cleavage/methylation domain-containing protein